MRDREQQLVEHRIETEFRHVLQTAIAKRKFGQFGLIVSLNDGLIKTFQRHEIETLKGEA